MTLGHSNNPNAFCLVCNEHPCRLISAFSRNYLQTFRPSEEYRRLYELAREYDKRCEAFDKRVCSGMNDRGIAIPISWVEMGKCSHNARQVFKELMVEVESLGFTSKDFRIAIREVMQ